MNVMIFWVCVAIGSLVYAAIIWSLVAYRKTEKQKASFHKNTTIEIAWTVIPLLIIIAMTIPAAKVLIHLYRVENSEIEGRRTELVGQQLAIKVNADFAEVRILKTLENSLNDTSTSTERKAL